MQANIYLSGAFLLYRSLFFIYINISYIEAMERNLKDDRRDSTRVFLNLCPLHYCPPASSISRIQAETAVTNIDYLARFEVLKAVLLKISVFWQVALCSLGEWFLMFQRHQVLRNVGTAT
jgi:hypothetical protein